jgi:prolyl-tRNA editing enzyme YbaK/EbsC (Cys-tRNA(Pro) deacylase)
MVNEKVKEFLISKNLGDRLTEHTETIDTVEHAAQQIGCSEPEIAKTLSFVVDEKPVTGAEGWCDVCKGWEDEDN